MFVYSAISCDEIRSVPILRAWVRTWRYRLRRAATPTVRRSGTYVPSQQPVTTAHIVSTRRSRHTREPTRLQYRTMIFLVEGLAQSLDSVDFYNRNARAILPLQNGISGDIHHCEIASAYAS